LVDLRIEAVLGDDVVAAPGEAPAPVVLLGCSAFVGGGCPPAASSTSVEGFATLLDETGFVTGYGVTLDDESEPATYDELFSSNGLAAFPIDSPALTPDVQGVRLLRLWAVDAAGNRAVVATRQVLVDTLPPAGTLTVAQSAAALLSPVVDVSVASDDDLVAVELAETGRPPVEYLFVSSPLTASLTLGTVGSPTTVVATLRDRAGNEATLTSAPVTVRSSVQLVAPALTNDVTRSISVTGAAVTTARFWIGDTAPDYPVAASTTVALADLVTTDGEHVIYAQGKDAVGNETAVLSARVVLDTTAPQVSAAAVAAGLYDPETDETYLASVGLHAVDLDATDEGSGVAAWGVSEGATAPDPAGLTYTAVTSAAGLSRLSLPVTLSSGEGARTLWVVLRDKAGNTATPYAVDVIVDTLPPAGTLTVAQSAAALLSPVVDVSVASDDDLVAVELAETGRPPVEYLFVSSPLTASLTLGTVGSPTTVVATLRDRAGNEATLTSAPVTVRSSVQLVAPALTNDVTRSISVTGAAVTTARFWIGDTAPDYPVAASTTVALADLVTTDGEHVIYAQGKDAVGNETAVLSARVVLDTTAPQVSAAAVAAGLYDPETDETYLASVGLHAVDLDATDEGSGVAAWGVSEGATAPDPAGLTYTAVTSAAGLSRLSLPVTLSSGEGARTLWVVLRDKAGNTATPYAVDVIVDTLPPSPPMVAIANDATYVLASSIDVVVSSADTGIAEVAFARDGEATTDFRPADSDTDGSLLHTEFLTLKPGDGVRTIAVKLRDRAGNESAEVSDAVIVDSAITLVAPSLTNDEATVLSLTGNAVANARFWTGAAAPEYPVTPATTLPLSSLGVTEGTIVLFAQAKDAAGNESPVFSAAVELDKTPPLLQRVLLEPDGGSEGRTATSFVSAGLALYFTTDALAGSVEPGGQMAVVTLDGALLSSDPLVSQALDEAVPVPLSLALNVLLPAGDGEKSACVRVTDAAGNDSEIRCDAIRLDTEPPEAPTILPLTGTLRSLRATLRFTALAMDPRPQGEPFVDVHRYEVTSPGEPPRIYAGIDVGAEPAFTLRPGEENEVCVRAIDDAGNKGSPACARYHEESSKTVVGNGIDTGEADLSGDYLAYVGRGGYWLHDLTRGEPLTYDDENSLALVIPGLDYNGFRPGYMVYGERPSQLRLAGDTEHLNLLLGPTERYGGGTAVYLQRMWRDDTRQPNAASICEDISGESNYEYKLPTDPGVYDNPGPQPLLPAYAPYLQRSSERVDGCPVGFADSISDLTHETHRVLAESADVTSQHVVFVENGSLFSHTLDGPVAREVSCEGLGPDQCAAFGSTDEFSPADISLCQGTNLRVAGDAAIWCQRETWKETSALPAGS
ncbi:MAG: hypothetical protein ACO3JL_12485, partial [Myxococcota bacterium]